MNILLMSDLHLEFHKDNGKSFISSLNNKNIDVLVLAGDITTHDNISEVMKQFCDKYSHVLLTLGNHEFYHSSKEKVYDIVQKACQNNSNLYWLEKTTKTLNDVKFVGATLWFGKSKTPTYLTNDFKLIKDFEKWVYEDNAHAKTFLENEVEPGDFVITHYLPSYKSVHPMYENSALNSFFVCPMDEMILNNRPMMWAFGHTHFSFDYYIGQSRLISNPFGYLRQEENKNFNENFVIKIYR